MRFLSWLDGLNFNSVRRRTQRGQPLNPRRKTAGGKLSVEALEDRSMPSFLTPVNYAAGTNPQAIVTADFNGDGRLDLAVANSSSSNVSVLLGNGDGTFQLAQNSATGAGPKSLAVGDFNADGKLDLATANNYDVSVLLGNGNGSFGAASNIGVVGNPASVAVGDFNGDGLMDLGVTSSYSYSGYYGSSTYSYANVLVGDGLGGFSGPNATFIDYAYATSAVAVNLNGDAYDDFATFDTYGYVAVLMGDSSGYLQGPTGYFFTGDYSYGVAAGDVNGDGANDLVTANFYGHGAGVLLGDGSGGFSGPTNYDVGGFPTSIVLGDFTHDGHLDVAAANYNSDDVGVLYGGGDGTFSTPTHSATGSSPYSIAAGDFNGDGWLDAATANQGDNTVSVLINDHNWPAPPPPPPPTVSINDVAVTEGNTGTTDATFTISLSKASSQDVTVHYATADGTATAGSDYTAASGDVTIPHGQTTYAVTIAVTGDRVAESTETFAVNLSAPVNATIGDGQGTGTIVDDEPLISINDVTVTEGNTGRVSATFTVSLSAVYDADVTIHYDTANGTATAGSDYTAASGTVTIPAGQTSKTLTVAVLGDRVAEPTETFVVNLSAPVNAGVSDGQGVGTILDDEPRISIKNVTKKEGNGGTTQFIFTVTLSAAYDQAVTLNYATANGTATAGSDYQAKSGTLTFAPGVTSMTITILVYGEKTKEADETFFVNLSGASSNAFFLAPQGVGTIQDNDTPPGKKK
jgi:hypothetical protein